MNEEVAFKLKLYKDMLEYLVLSLTENNQSSITLQIEAAWNETEETFTSGFLSSVEKDVSEDFVRQKNIMKALFLRRDKATLNEFLDTMKSVINGIYKVLIVHRKYFEPFALDFWLTQQTEYIEPVKRVLGKVLSALKNRNLLNEGALYNIANGCWQEAQIIASLEEKSLVIFLENTSEKIEYFKEIGRDKEVIFAIMLLLENMYSVLPKTQQMPYEELMCYMEQLWGEYKKEANY